MSHNPHVQHDQCVRVLQTPAAHACPLLRTCLRSVFAALSSSSASSSAASCFSWFSDLAMSFCCLRAFSSASACAKQGCCQARRHRANMSEPHFLPTACRIKL